MAYQLNQHAHYIFQTNFGFTQRWHEERAANLLVYFIKLLWFQNKNDLS